MERCQLSASDTGMGRRRTTFSGDATMVDQSWPEYGSPQPTPTPPMGRGGWSGGSGLDFAARGQWFNSNRGRGFQGYGRGFGNRAENEQPAERYEETTPRPGLDAEQRSGRGRGRGRGCYVCGTFGCHSRNHVGEQAAELRRYEQPRSLSVPPDNRSQENGPRSPPAGNRAPSPSPCPQSQ